MSLPTVGQNTQAMQQPINLPDVWRSDALATRFLSFPANVSLPCNNSVIMPAPRVPLSACGEVLGMATNRGILQYQFNALPNPTFCGQPVTGTSTDCTQCPCARQGCTTAASVSSCDYGGFGRDHNAVFGPGSVGRSGLNRWG